MTRGVRITPGEIASTTSIRWSKGLHGKLKAFAALHHLPMSEAVRLIVEVALRDPPTQEPPSQEAPKA